MTIAVSNLINSDGRTFDFTFTMATIM